MNSEEVFQPSLFIRIQSFKQSTLTQRGLFPHVFSLPYRWISSWQLAVHVSLPPSFASTSYAIPWFAYLLQHCEQNHRYTSNKMFAIFTKKRIVSRFQGLAKRAQLTICYLCIKDSWAMESWRHVFVQCSRQDYVVSGRRGKDCGCPLLPRSPHTNQNLGSFYRRTTQISSMIKIFFCLCSIKIFPTRICNVCLLLFVDNYYTWYPRELHLKQNIRMRWVVQLMWYHHVVNRLDYYSPLCVFNAGFDVGISVNVVIFAFFNSSTTFDNIDLLICH